MRALLLALLLASTPAAATDAQRPDLSAYLEPICGEVVATITVEERPHLLVYDCSGAVGVWRVFPAYGTERELLCRGPVAVIADDDPGLALVADPVALAIERASSCDPAERVPEGQPWFCEDYLAEGEPPFPGCLHEGGRDPKGTVK